MLEFIKKQRIGFYASIVTAIFIIVSLALVVANGNQSYFSDTADLGGIIVMLVIALVLTIAIPVVTQFTFADNKFVKIGIDVARAIVALLIIVAGITFAGERVESFGFVFGSNLEQGNKAAFTAASQAILVIEMCVVTWVVSMVTAFFSVKKED